MTIHLPDDLESFIRAEVHLGHFASEDDAVAEAVRLLRSQFGTVKNQTAAVDKINTQPMPDPLLGAMRDAADEMDAIVADSMSNRENQPWRLSQ